MPDSTVRSLKIAIAVFACGAFVMAFEIVASRILAPFIGTSTYIWTSLIGVILASLSLGYHVGGRLADRHPDIRILAGLIFAAGTFVAVTELIKEIVLSYISSAPIGIELRSVVASLVLFGPASVCLGCVTPYAVKLRMSSLADTGKTVGRLYALSTVGSILGTFVAGFFLIPFVGSTRTLYIISGGLIAVSIMLFPLALTRSVIASFVVIAFSIISNESSIYLLREQNDLHDIDTEYSRVRVFKTVDPRSGNRIQALATDPYSIQSAMLLDSDEPAFEYSRFYHLVRHFRPDFRNVLLIGGAGYSVPKEFLRTYADLALDVVEIDPQMTAIARRYFRLKDDPRMKIIHEDGRTFLNNAPDKRYDAILMDAFGSLFAVPYQLTTRECVKEIERNLTDNGVVIFNLGSAISGEGSGFLQAELATYRSVFPRVFVFKVYSDHADDRLQNLIIVALKSPEEPTLRSSDPEIERMLGHLYSAKIDATKPILTDDLASVEYYNAIAQDLNLKRSH
ncbi:MAG: fused MFS/spermidine synthase [Acidobacteriota bacterium]